jgi:hypothetical protein
MSATEKLETTTGASHVITRGNHGKRVEEVGIQLMADNASILTIAERIVQLEEAVRDRDHQIVTLHEEVAYWSHEADGHARDAAYFEGKSSDGPT